MEINIKNKTTSLIAKRGSGKSNLLKFIVQSYKHEFDKIYCISPTEEVNSFYADMVPKNCIFSEWSEEWTELLITKMTEINKGKPEKEKKNVLLILDDCMADTNFGQSKSLKKLYMRGRHINIAVIVTCQYLYNLPPVCRNNTDWIIVGQMNRQSIILLAEEYLSGDISREEFNQLYHRSTKDFSFLVVNNNSIKDADVLNNIYGIVRTPSEYVV